MIDHITEEIIEDVKNGAYSIFIRAESRHEGKDYVSGEWELILRDTSAEEVNRGIRNKAESLIKSMLPKNISTLGSQSNYVVIIKHFKDDSKTEELSRKPLNIYTSGC